MIIFYKVLYLLYALLYCFTLCSYDKNYCCQLLSLTNTLAWEAIMLKAAYTAIFYFLLTMVTAGLIFVMGACATSQEEKGAKNHWRNPKLPAWKIGQTTEMDVLGKLGPPSQIIALENQVVYYYLQEQSLGKSYIFVVWNRSERKIHYDRAIFFFNKQGVLNKFAYSPEAFPYDPES